jgi:hypothetical protein
LIKVPLMVLQNVLRRSEPELIRCESSRPDEHEGDDHLHRCWHRVLISRLCFRQVGRTLVGEEVVIAGPDTKVVEPIEQAQVLGVVASAGALA